ncbi:MAG: Fe-S cluster assembly ATPase SufC [Nanoarchaeota archaeon]|nr:Fe-S cluster assembly ATPase SufC [Nanoarchaeota archaeon]
MTLEIIDLHVEVDGKEIIKGITVTFHHGKIHALMGPNGSGKSTLAHAIIGHPRYKITKGRILLDGEDITFAKPTLRARKGLFLSFQYPPDIPGVTIRNFLRTAVNNLRDEDTKYSVVAFQQLLKEKMAELAIDPSFANRYVNDGLSGGEKKRLEMLQLAMLEPKYGILDEPDSGTDVDALKIIAEVINKIKRSKGTGFLLITHYNKILKHLEPDEVLVLVKGQMTDVGNAELADYIESNGYAKYLSPREGSS